MPPPPLLLINLNNTMTKSAVVESGRWKIFRPTPTSGVTPAFFEKLARTYPQHHVVVASVVPSASAHARDIWPRSKIEWLTHRSPLGIPLRYPEPARIGADRLANAVATAATFQLPAVVVDFGTAVTFDIIDHDRAYIGGVIAPGLNAMGDYLYNRTALLPKLKWAEPKRHIGKNTMEAMQIGAVTGYRGMIREILKGISSELKFPIRSLIATGGHGECIAEGMPEIDIVDPLLTLKGLCLVAENRWT
jgi:type III pantothenate kinase